MSEEDEWRALPLTDQFSHKNWKARKLGYETATKAFSTAQPTDPLIRDFIYESSLWKAAVADSNVAAQGEALNAYNAFLEAAGQEGARKTRGHTVQGIVEKGLMGRPGPKATAMEGLMLLIELDKADPVLEELLPFLGHKQPKIIAATLSALTSVYKAYGCKTVEPKAVVKCLPKIFGHADKNVRAEGQGLTVELYRWLREAMKPLFWGELKEVQRIDLEKLFEPLRSEPQPKQERLLRSQQAAVEQAEAAGEVEGEAEVEEEEVAIDLEPEYEAVDVFKKIPADFSDRLASTKWKDRKEALDEVFAAVNVPAMQDGSFDDIIRGCAKSMKDANIAVVTVAANVVECIAKGLRKGFTKYRGTILGAMLERFKEKKQSVVDAISAACDAVFLATSLGECESDILEGMKSKNPQVKEQSTRFLVRALKSVKEAPTIEQTKELAEGGKKLLTESAPGLRDAGAEVLGVLWRIMGDRNMLVFFEGLDEIKKGKIKEFCDAAEVRAKWKPKTAPAPKAAAAAPAAKKATAGKRPAGTAKKAAPARAVSPPLMADESAPLAPRPTSRPAGVGKATAGLKAPGAGLRAPGSGLGKPGMGLKAPAAGGAASPARRQVVSPDYDEPETPVAAAPKAGLGRGLAGRPLAKPALQPSSPPPREQGSSANSGLGAAERQELSDLRSEVQLLRSQTSDLRTDKLRLSSRVMELENQEAQFREDKTRDLLQIKAKETQIVRVRGDLEEAEERGNSLSREIDRMKREMTRLRANSQSGNGGYNVPSARSYGDAGSGGHGGGYERSGGGEEKENVPDEGEYESEKTTAPPARSQNTMPPPPSYTATTHATRRPMSNGHSQYTPSSGRATPLSQDGNEGNNSGSGGGGGNGSLVGSRAGGASTMDKSQQSEGVESWRRAAEVTQNLKARIEMMKARQNIGRGP
ncbi:hypothetical protein LTR56_012053 [Elasticomyces elasticus]|nr:hypothetical protein LTR56_012053 [Elasticomyces elasticus]KAK3651803.1 hypothetical protein LTR22_011972 [Elasticomyces elasticus]KAK4930161.1 hypothetical protein LTR49_003194 [Elasticomyces elasticus]KAK5752498.1 hypothetical protein LTS12_017435 [Elasticomyces elasticus]